MQAISERRSRRDLVSAFGRMILAVGVASSCFDPAVGQSAPPSESADKDKWLDELFQKRLLGGPLHLSRFVERVYFTTKTIGWSPNPGDSYKRVDVPIQFVTDFASVPRPFWSILPPDGEYAYAAIIHDYLYWTQTRSRAESDDILKLAMQDLRVNKLAIETIYLAVRAGGGFAWDENARLKQKGEKRVLKIVPDTPTIRWADWKLRTDAFID